MAKRSTHSHEPGSLPFDFALDVLGQGKLSRRIFKIPSDQLKILNEPTAWAESLFRHPQGLANVSGQVLDNLFKFHDRQLEVSEPKSSAVPSRSPNGPRGDIVAVPPSPSGPGSDPAHEEDASDSDSSPGTPIPWESSPPPVTRTGPPEETAPEESAPEASDAEASDAESFVSQLPAAPVASMHVPSSPGGPIAQHDQSSLEQPFESQLPVRPPLQAGAGNSNMQKRPAFNEFPSSSPALDEELEIVQPVAYDKEMMPPPPHKTVEPNPTPPSAQQAQVVPSTFPEPHSSKNSSQLQQRKAARKHRVQPYVDVEKMLTAKLPTAKPMTTSGLRAPPKGKTSNIRARVIVQPSQSPKPRPLTPSSRPQVAHSPLSSPRDNPLSILTQPPPSLKLPKVVPLSATHQAISPLPSSTLPAPVPIGDDPGLQPDGTATHPVVQNDRRQENLNLEERVAHLEQELAQALLDKDRYAEQARSRSPRSIVRNTGQSKPTTEANNPLEVFDQDTMVIDPASPQVEMTKIDRAQPPFDQYVKAYMGYTDHGSLWSFVSACVYIHVLQRKKALASYQYDDFIRAWTEGFVPYVESSIKPLTAIEWYMENVDNTDFQYRKGIITRKTIGLVFETYPEEAKEARTHLIGAAPERGPLPIPLPPAKPVITIPSTPATGTAQNLKEVLVEPEEQTATGADDPTGPTGDVLSQQHSQGSQSDPIDGTIAEARKLKPAADPLRRSTSETSSRKRPAVDVLVAASPKRAAADVTVTTPQKKATAASARAVESQNSATVADVLVAASQKGAVVAAPSHGSSNQQSIRSTPSATLQPSSMSGGLPRSTGPWQGPRKHANNPEKRAKAYQRFLKKRIRDQDSIVNSSAPPGGTPSSAQKE
ncbi:hypothetical protein PG989_011571 [Apiospora arundinis]